MGYPDEVEQDREVKQLRIKNDADNKKARRILDGGILAVATMYVEILTQCSNIQ